MNKIEIPDRSFIMEIASTWEELSELQVSKILQLAGKSSTEAISATRFKVECFYIIANVTRNWISIVKEHRLSKKDRLRKYSAIYQIAGELTGFLFVDPAADRPELNYNTVYNLFPKLKGTRCNLFGPDQLLIDISFGEFRAAFTSMGDYFNTRTEESLNEFVACLYRPAQLEAVRFKREKYNSEFTPVYADQLKKVPMHIKTGILLWFTSCIKYFQKEDMIINGKTINLSPIFPERGPDEKASVGLGWTGILYSIAKDQVFGDVEKTEERNLFDVLLYMYDNHLQNERLKALQNKR